MYLTTHSAFINISYLIHPAFIVAEYCDVRIEKRYVIFITKRLNAQMNEHSDGIELKAKILLALAVLGMEFKGGNYFSSKQIEVWLKNHPELEKYKLRSIQQQLAILRERNSEDKNLDSNLENKLENYPQIDCSEPRTNVFNYRLSKYIAETPLTAKMILKLEECQGFGNPISPEDEKTVISEIYEEFLGDKNYRLSSKEVIAKKVANAVNSYYFTRDADNNLHSTTRCNLERRFLNLLADWKGDVPNKPFRN